jgi:hypothetical protein
MKTRVTLFALVSFIFAGATALPAQAMGSGNPYEDAQVGLNYVVYQPSYTAGLSLKSFGMHKCGVGDLALNINYGSGKKNFLLTESSVKNICPMNMMLIRGATRTVVTKPGAGNLTATQVVVISVGIPRAQLNQFFSHLVPRYTAPGSKVVAPVLVDPTVVTDATVALTNVVVITVADPEKWSATVTDPTIVSFTPGGNQGTYTTNPGLKPLKKGTTTVTLNHDGTTITFTVTVY